jgi:hypothetical protein
MENLMQHVEDIPANAPHACSCQGTAGKPARPNENRFVYALGKIEMRFPRVAVEKEFAQAVSLIDTEGMSDRQVCHAVLSRRENRYLSRKLGWVLSIQGIDTYLLQPREDTDHDMLTRAIRPLPGSGDVDVVIGALSPAVPPELHAAPGLPLVFFEQLYAFSSEQMIKAIPRPEKLSETDFTATATELFWRIMQLTDNTGSSDEHRALNYLAMRYPAIYSVTAEAHAGNSALTAVDVRKSPMSGTRKLVDVILTFTHRKLGMSSKSFVRVDVTEEFPFLASKLAPYYDH